MGNGNSSRSRAPSSRSRVEYQNSEARTGAPNSANRLSWAAIDTPIVMTGVGQFRVGMENQLRSQHFMHPRRNQLAATPVKKPPTIEKAVKVRSLINLQPDSVKLVSSEIPGKFGLHFSYNSECEGNIYLFFVAVDTKSGTPDQRFKEKSPLRKSALIGKLEIGEDKIFKSDEIPSGIIDTSSYTLDELTKYEEGGACPVIVVLEADKSKQVDRAGNGSTETDGIADSQSTFVSLRCEDQEACKYGVNLIKQTIRYNDQVFVYKKLYTSLSATDSKAQRKTDAGDDDVNDDTECVICLSETRNAITYPCLHMCLCETCAQILRQSASPCPLCRSPIESFLLR